MNINLFYISIGLTEVVGLFILTYEFFFSSQTRKKNLILRSVISGIGGTLSILGLMILFFFSTSPINFWSEWSLPRLIGFSIIVVFPLYCVLTVACLVYFVTLGKFKEIAMSRLHKNSEVSKKKV